VDMGKDDEGKQSLKDSIVRHADQAASLVSTFEAMLHEGGVEHATLEELNARLVNIHRNTLHPLHPLVEHLRTQAVLAEKYKANGSFASVAKGPVRNASEVNEAKSEDMRGIKHTQLREMLAYKFPVRIAIDILQNIGRYNFDDERKQDARGAGRLAVSLHPDLLRAWQRKTFEAHNNLAIVRYFNLNRIMHNVLGQSSKYGCRSHFFEGQMMSRLSRKLPCLIDYAAMCNEEQAGALRTTLVGLAKVYNSVTEKGLLAQAFDPLDHGSVLMWLSLANTAERDAFEAFGRMVKNKRVAHRIPEVKGVSCC